MRDVMDRRRGCPGAVEYDLDKLSRVPPHARTVA
jgi:hypothetical protein